MNKNNYVLFCAILGVISIISVLAIWLLYSLNILVPAGQLLAIISIIFGHKLLWKKSIMVEFSHNDYFLPILVGIISGLFFFYSSHSILLALNALAMFGFVFASGLLLFKSYKTYIQQLNNQ